MEQTNLPITCLVVQIIVRPGIFLLPVLGGVQFVDSGPEIGWVPSKGDVQLLYSKNKTDYYMITQ